MAEESISLKPFLLGDPQGKALSECAAATAALNTGLVGLGALDWAELATEIGEKLEQMFDIRLTDVLATAWKDYQALAECADPSKHPAGETIRLPMVDHSIETTFRPCLDVTVGARPPIRIAFEITLALKLKGLVLSIEDATIRTCMGLFLSSHVFGLLPVLCSERGKPFLVRSPAIRFAERADGVKGPKR